MNSTTWIIEPNLAVWALLVIATFALCSIAWYLRRLSRENTSSAIQVLNTPQSAWRNVDRAVTWLSFVLVLIGIGYLTTIGNNDDKVTDFSALATVMGVLVTLLVGWSIYQVIETKDSLRDITVLRTDFAALRSEIDVLHQIHEAYVWSMEGEDIRREGHSCVAFEYHMNSAFLFMRDLVHYDTRFMHALALMRTSLEDVDRPAMGPRAVERDQFVRRREQYISRLEELLRQVRGRLRFIEQAESDISIMISSLQNISVPPQTPSAPTH